MVEYVDQYIGISMGYQKTETLQVLMKIARYMNMNYNYEKTKEVLNEK